MMKRLAYLKKPCVPWKFYSLWLIMGGVSGFFSVFFFSTLAIWLNDQGFSLDVQKKFYWISLPYGLKFFFSSLFQKYQKGVSLKSIYLKWMRRCFGGILLGWLALFWGQTKGYSIYFFQMVALILCVMAALQDFVLETARLHWTQKAYQTLASSWNVAGYRLGFVLGSLWTLTMAHYFNWATAFLGSMLSYSFFFLIMYRIIKNIAQESSVIVNLETEFSGDAFPNLWREMRDFFFKFWKFSWVFFLLFMMAYKWGDLGLGFVWPHFFFSFGYDKILYVHWEKTWGALAFFSGIILGGWRLQKTSFLSLWRFWFLAQIGLGLFLGGAKAFYNMNPLSHENLFWGGMMRNFFAGLGATWWSGFFSLWISSFKEHMIVGYGLFSSIGALMRLGVIWISGEVWKHSGSWEIFFQRYALGCGLCFLALHILLKRSKL